MSDAVAYTNASLVDTSKSSLVFKSYTNRSEYWELWFTKQHIHDQGAVKNSFIYLIPGIEKYIGWEQNKLVNRTRKVQEERGITYVQINAANYNLKEKLVLKVIA